MIRRELGLLAFAVRFLTRLPAPGAPPWSEDLLARSVRYFPVVGSLVGAICAGVLAGARMVWPSGPLPALLAVAAAVLLSGAFHEDGLADTADGLGGGQSRDHRLAIMKDSRLGTYGALALGLTLGARVFALASIAPTGVACAVLVFAHAAGRAAAVAAMAAMPYAADPQASRLKAVARDVRRSDAAIAILIAVAPLALLSPATGIVLAAAGGLAALWPALASRRLIGGYTGDVLGAVEQACETGVLLGASAVLAMATFH
jgi:adenosylcobinamide-GDP ribazoletransferase